MVGKKILNSCWKDSLTQALQDLVPRADSRVPIPVSPRLAVIGIGNELNGDDAAGVRIIRTLRHQVINNPAILLVEAGPAPENFTSPIRKFKPDLVLLLDAVNMDSEPGKVAWVEWESITGISALTHRLPPTVFGSYLIEVLNCRVALIGIQVQSVEFDTQPCLAVNQAVRRVSKILMQVLNRFPEI